MSVIIFGQNITQVLTNTGLTPSQILIDKVTEISRKIEIKISNLANSPKYIKFKLPVAIEIAYKLVTKGQSSVNPINRERLFSATKVPINISQNSTKSFVIPPVYRQFLTICQNYLNISETINHEEGSIHKKPSPLEVLNLRYDDLPNLLGDVKSICNEYMVDYKEIFYDKLPDSRKKDFDFEKPLYDCACFYVIAQENKVSIEKDFILDLAECDNRIFQSTVDQIKQARQIIASREKGIKRKFSASESSVEKFNTLAPKLSRLDSLIATSKNNLEIKRKSPLELNNLIKSFKKSSENQVSASNKEDEITIKETKNEDFNIIDKNEEVKKKKENYLKWKESKLKSFRNSKENEISESSLL